MIVAHALRSVMIGVAISCVVAGASLAQTKKEVDPKAAQAIARVSAKLRELQRYTLDADVTTKTALATGGYRTFEGKAHYDVSKPSHLHAAVNGKNLRREVTYDGATLTVFAPDRNVYARVAAPGTLPTVLQEVRRRAGFELPIAEVLAWDSEAAVLQGATRASFTGEALVRGTACRQYSYKRDGVSWELYVDGRGLLCKLSRVDTRDPGLPGYSAELTWNTDVRVDDARFTFTPPPGAREVAWEAIGEK
ncbi:DUF2092 domain-containing protein [Lysobacter sp. LF1]|uniref:DUF2092 domain-containing protein n=1 Tax=Lysobacter stagni TaxID=3045172 RepID=A0ABT6XEK4_9GAMM|nr:DUF2092 domain-containing protein [Lysobacter sp. LF1]MDI9238575.1 DUF2092 domain-containing protein [Lysobacter sp. LF1]